jgi:DsbC/DsbD-like thiol-disulfide interchange protein
MITSILLLAALASTAPRAPAKEKPDGNRLVKLSLLADHAAIRPGDTITLAAKLAIEPKWHIYWQNPGDAGVPTKIEVRVPEGFTVGAVRYPVPKREQPAEEILSYVYTDEATFLVDVKAPASFASATHDNSNAITFTVDARWLVCTEICLQGKAETAIALPIAAATDAPRLANEKEIAAARAKLPLPYDELFAIEGFHASDFTDWKKPFSIAIPGALELDFYPSLEDPITLNVSTLQQSAGGRGINMKIQFEPPAGYEGPHFGFSGLLAVRTAQGRAYYEVRGGYGANAPGTVPATVIDTKSPPKK